MTQSTRTVSYALRANTSGVPGLTAFYQSLERIRGVQDQIKRQGDVIASLRDRTVTIRLKFETAALNAEMKRLQNQTVDVNVRVGAQNEIGLLKDLMAQLTALKNVSTSDASTRLQASRLLGQEYKTQAEAVRLVTAEQNKAASAARAAAAQTQVTVRLAMQQAAEDKRAHREGIQGIENEVKAYRNLWQTRTISSDQVYREQARLKQQALEMALTVDRQSDAYRRLTQVAASAQRTMDSSQGINTPGGFGAGVSQGLTNALGQFGVTGDLISGLIRLMESKRAQARGTATKLGEETLAGLQQGLQSNQSGIRQAADAAADSVAEAIRRSLDIHSPSRVTEYLGRMAGLGFVNGVRSMTDDVRRAALGLTGAATGSLGMGAGNIGLGGFASVAAMPALGIDPAQASAAAVALSALNAELAEAAPAAVDAAEAGVEVSDAVAGMGDSVVGAAEHVKGLRDAHGEQEEASRNAAVNEAKTAIAFAATAVAIGAVAVAASASYQAAAQYEKAMNSAGATTEATAADIDALSKATFDERLIKLGISATTAASGVEELGSEGLNTAQIIDGGLVNALTLAKAVGVDVAVASSVAAASTKAFGLESKELARVTDIVTTAVNGTSIRMNDFTQAIAQGGSVANQSGVDFLTFTSAISLMTDKAISASDAGTSLKTFLQALTPNSKEATKVMDDLGFSAFTADGEFKSLSQIVGELRESFSKLTPEQRAVRAETVFGADGIRAFNILVNAGSEGLEERTRFLDKMGATTDAAAQKTKGALGAQEQFNASLENFNISAGQSFLPAATKMLEWGGEFLTVWRGINEEYGKFLKGSAAFGAEEYNLPTWLKQSGLRESDLTKDEKYDAEGLLRAMQFSANTTAKNAEQWRKMGLEGAAQKEESDSIREIGKLGVKLGAIQAAASQRPRTEGPQTGGTASEVTPEVVGKALVSLMGMGGRTVLNEFGVSGKDYHHDGSVRADATHNGIDFAAPRGAPILAPFSGTLSVREDKMNGKVFELVDEMGNKLVGIHLDSFDKGVLKALEEGGGKALVGQGTRIGGVGNSGTTAGSATHLHLMGYAKGSTTAVNPLTIGFQGGAGGAGDTGYADTFAKPDFIGKTTQKSGEALKVEARRILKALETKDPDALNAAKAVLKTFEDSGDRAKAALEIVRSELQKTKKDVSQFGQGYDKLSGQMGSAESHFRLNDDAGAYAKSLELISKNALVAAAAEKKKWGETKKYDALFALGGDAASKARQQREGVARDQDQEEKKQEAREKEARARAARVAEAARKGNETLAQQETARLEQMRENDVKNAGENLAAKLALEKSYKDKIIKAQKDVADVTYSNAMGAAARGPAQERAQAELIAKNARDADYLKADSDAKTRLDSAQKAADNKAQARNKEQAQIRAKYAAEKRNLDVSEAAADLARTQELNRKELTEFKGTAAQKVALIKRQAQDEFNASKAVAGAERDKAIRDFQNDIKNPNKARNIQGAEDAYTDAVTKAKNLQTAAGTQATEDQTKAIQSTRDAYSKLADGMREKIATGKVELADLTAYRLGMDGAADAATKGGVAQTQYIKGARASAEALYQAGIDAQIAAGMFNDLGDGQSLAAEAGRGYAMSLNDALAAMPPTIEGNAEYLKLLQDMAAAGQVSGAVVAHISDLMRDQALDAEIAAGAYANVVDGFDRAARAGAGYVATQQDAIDQIPGSVEANATYLKVLQDLEDAGKLMAGTVEEVSQAMRDQEVIAANGAAQMERLTEQAGKTSDALLELGNTEGAMRTLEDALSQAMDAAMRGEPAADAIALLTDRINALAASTALADGFNSFVSGLGGTLEDQISAVVDQLDRVTDPAMTAKLRALLTELRQGLGTYEDPSKAGYTPNPNGGGFTGQTPSGLTPEAIATARDLTAALNTELDPATLGTAMTGAADLLASEVGQALPAATRKGLEDGIKNAQAFQDALASITADAVTDGWERASKADAPAQNVFQDYAAQIMGGDFDLSNPEVLRGLNDGLELARQKGKLTVSELGLLQALIESINAHPLDVLPHAEGWKQLETWNDKLGELETNLQSGAISQKEFNDQGAAMLPTLDRMADRADDGSEEGRKLAAAFRVAAAALRDMGAASSESASKLDRLKADLLNVGQAVQGIFSMFGQDDLAQGMGALAGAVGSGFEAVAKFKSGDIFGAAAASVNVLDNVGKAIDSFNPKLKALQKEMLELADAEKQAMGSRMVGGQNGFLNPYYEALKKDSEALTRKANASFWQRLKWDVFGGAPEVLEKGASEAMQKASTVFNEFGSSLYSTLESELTSAMDDGDFSKASANVGKMLDRFVNRLTVQALIAKSKLGDLAKQLADEVAGGQDTGGTLAQIRTETDNVIGQAQAIAPTPSSSGPTSPASPEQSAVTGANFYVANSSKIDVFDGAVTRMDAMYQRHEGILSRHGDVLGRHSDMLERLMRDGITLKDTQGNYRGALR
ncbi:phage tail tape measure protein [Deinococcus arenicola]|uniref:Phage tail tape measure protein n=1 Tax=Deinococcus arenicola TaxID=2994950 RepID=A0ABU4DUG6_9DEIO|nr:phage tail tape measure protein [Deinococcus sp. ZS9-10]MDV6376033.1 phage tail tape measure protein [Deinococcus sp. ZS9-10]